MNATAKNPTRMQPITLQITDQMLLKKIDRLLQLSGRPTAMTLRMVLRYGVSEFIEAWEPDEKKLARIGRKIRREKIISYDDFEFLRAAAKNDTPKAAALIAAGGFKVGIC
jgi:hypothetical protein